jgi:hypothetical protein
MLTIQKKHFVKGLDPVADALAGTVGSDVVNMKNWKVATFIIFVGVGATGTSVITVEACDNVTPSNTSPVPFVYREITTGDTEGALTKAAAAGFTMTAGSSRIVVVQVEAEALAASGYGYLRLKAVESVDSPVLAGILIELEHPRFASEPNDTAIV